MRPWTNYIIRHMFEPACLDRMIENIDTLDLKAKSQQKEEVKEKTKNNDKPETKTEDTTQ